jgi:hypothetical protein
MIGQPNGPLQKKKKKKTNNLNMHSQLIHIDLSKCIIIGGYIYIYTYMPSIYSLCVNVNFKKKL